jgi:hypothetical protein
MSVQCIGLVFSSYEDKELSTSPHSIIVPLNNGHLIPITVSRVLSKIADFVMYEFDDDSEKEAYLKVWNEEYPHSFRGAGAQLDLLLHRAYRCLHGINLSSPHLVAHVSKECMFPVPSTGNTDGSFYFLPESITAAVQLYRCVRRSYFSCRKRVPAEVFKCILSVLPKEKESTKMTAIKNFIYTANKETSLLLQSNDDLNDEMRVENDLDCLPNYFPSWILRHSDNILEAESICDDGHVECAKDIQLVRKGIWEYLADEPLPKLGSSSFFEGSQYDGSDRSLFERKVASETEIAVSKQLCAIIYAIAYDPSDEKKWYRAGLCIAVKLNLILDRLIPAERKFKLDTFLPPKNRKAKETVWRKERGKPRDLRILLADQRLSYIQSSSTRAEILGHDLSVYIEHQFCSAISLKMLQENLVKSEFDSRSKGILDSMISLLETRKYSLWQHEWGSFYVSALQLMRQRCFHIAACLSKEKEGIMGEEGIYSQVAESFGTAIYDELGFSARKQTCFEKRRKAILAAKLFQSSLESLRSSVAKDGKNCPATWESLLMIGKCYEKIANTLQGESYQGTRMYENYMCKALER